MKTPDTTFAMPSALDSLDSTKTAQKIGKYPVRRNTVCAEVLSHLLRGECLTGMDAVFTTSTTRLAAHIEYVQKQHGWTVERVSIDHGTNDGRIVVITAYYLSRATIRSAFDAGAMEFCRSVQSARAKLKAGAAKAKADAKRRNALRRIDPRQMSLIGGAP